MIPASSRGPIAWIAGNPVAANLLMLFLLIGGLLTTFIIKQEIFPEFDVDMIQISIPYPGTGPEEVEKGVVMAIEEAVRNVAGIKEIISVASEGSANIFVQLINDTDGNKALQDVKNAVDGVTNLPIETERPNVQMLTHRVNILTIVIYGDTTYEALDDCAQNMREELLRRPEITSVGFSGTRPQEISVEIAQDTLRRYNLTLEQVASTLRGASVDYAAGGVKTTGGEILLRVQERRYFGDNYADIPIITEIDGTIVRLGDIATIVDGWADTDQAAYYNDMPAIMITVASEGDQTPTEVSRAVKTYLEDLQSRLPAGINVSTFDDFSELYSDRINLLLRNGFIGLALVLLLLGLFLNIRLAFWVTMGIPISFLGAMLFLPSQDVSLNMLSLFAFIIALGIIVDDAIVVGENIFTHRHETDHVTAAVNGAREVAVPVFGAVLTNVLAFLPLLFVSGVMGKVFKVVPIVVCLAFSISLVEALLILPAHLGHSRERYIGGISGVISRLQSHVSNGLVWFIDRCYRPSLQFSLVYRYFVLTVAIGILIITIGYIVSGRTEFSFSPKAESDVVIAALKLPFGSPVEETRRVQSRLVETARELLDQYGGEKVYQGIFTNIGTTSVVDDVETGMIEGGHAASIRIFLVPSDDRTFSGEEFSIAWRHAMGDIVGIESLTFEVIEMGPPAGRPIDIQLSHPDVATLEAAASDLAGQLEQFSAALDIDDGYQPGKPQFDFSIRPEAYSLGMTPATVGSQVRSYFYGAEALRLQRGRHEVKVMVRLPEADRRRESSIENMVIRTPGGGELPLKEAVDIVRGRAYTSIRRQDGLRVLHVTSDVQPPSQKSVIMATLKDSIMPAMEKKYPGLTFSREGEEREIADAMSSLGKNYILSLIAIFVTLGVIFRSYIQPIIVMLSIPFGIIGAIIGHIIMGFNLSVISMLGVTALSGVVLNDALILIDFANQRRRNGASAFDAITDAGTRRFRPILLTTLTTFFGLAPMIFETSFQAKVMVPMAISLGYGIVFGTLITLLLVPAIYLIIEDIRRWFQIADTKETMVIREPVTSGLGE